MARARRAFFKNPKSIHIYGFEEVIVTFEGPFERHSCFSKKKKSEIIHFNYSQFFKTKIYFLFIMETTLMTQSHALTCFLEQNLMNTSVRPYAHARTKQKKDVKISKTNFFLCISNMLGIMHMHGEMMHNHHILLSSSLSLSNPNHSPQTSLSPLTIALKPQFKRQTVALKPQFKKFYSNSCTCTSIFGGNNSLARSSRLIYGHPDNPQTIFMNLHDESLDSSMST